MLPITVTWEARDYKLGCEMVLLLCFSRAHSIRGMNWIALRAEDQKAEKILKYEIFPGSKHEVLGLIPRTHLKSWSRERPLVETGAIFGLAGLPALATW